MGGHELSTETNFLSLHQRLLFPCVWAAIMHGTGVPVPPHTRLLLQEVRERGHHKRTMVRQSPDDLPVKLPGVEKWEVLTSAVDIYQSIHQGWVKTSGNMMWLHTSEGTHM